MLVVGVFLVVSGLIPHARAQTPDRSDVVLVLDFSASILQDKTTRNRFGAALERIADRVDEISADLTAGDTTVSIVRFATRAADVSGCADVKLLGSPAAVGHFADCLRAVAASYRKGPTTGLTRQIGLDTNYLAAMARAADHLPADAARPALILFTDGQHDVKGVPASRVEPARDALFGTRTSFALLPVGMGLDPTKRTALAAGLDRLKMVRGMPDCVSGAALEWPQVVFDSADQAGNAVAVALQDATCTFTVAPTPTPKPTPTPIPVRIQGISVTPGDGRVDLAWAKPVAGASSAPIVDYTARCQAGDGVWIESTDGVSLDPKATVEGLTNGTAYQCEIGAVTSGSTISWTPAGGVTPLGRPAAPTKPAVEALNSAVQVSIADAGAGVSHYEVECSPDNGATWPAHIDTSTASRPALVANLTNGTGYVCRVFAANTVGVSDASPVSDVVRPCAGLLDCNPTLVPILGGLGAVVVGGLGIALLALYRGRVKGHVIAVVDIVHTANVGHGSYLGIAFVRAPGTRTVTGIVAERGRGAEIQIHRLRDGRFRVRDKAGRREVADGDAVGVTDSMGVRHSLVLQAFDTNAASEVATRR